MMCLRYHDGMSAQVRANRMKDINTHILHDSGLTSMLKFYRNIGYLVSDNLVARANAKLEEFIRYNS